jgi:hypothetical protein
MVLNKLLRLVPTRVKAGDCRDRDQCGDQRILDRRNRGLVFDQIVTSLRKGILLGSTKAIWRRLPQNRFK